MKARVFVQQSAKHAVPVCAFPRARLHHVWVYAPASGYEVIRMETLHKTRASEVQQDVTCNMRADVTPDMLQWHQLSLDMAQRLFS